MENKSLTKVSMNLSQKSLKNVEEVSKLIQEDNKTRVVSSSLEITKEILQLVKNGKKIIVKNEDGSEQELKFII